MVDVEPADMSVTCPPEVVRLYVMVGNGTNRRGARYEAIFVVVTASTVEIGQERELPSVALPDQVLPENIGQVDLLVTPIELIQVGVSILFQHVEGRDVILPAVVVVVAENPGAKVCVIKNEAAEIAYEWLNADPGGNEIVIAR